MGQAGRRRLLRGGKVAAVALGLGAAVQPAPAQLPVVSSFGTAGLVDMPTARDAPDGRLQVTSSVAGGMARTTLTFQVTPRLSGSFRYSTLPLLAGAPVWRTLFDRSFDLHYRLIDEGRWRPAVAVGLRDLMGTGIYSSEYVVATKRLAPGLDASLGIGWGRLGSFGAFRNPLAALSPAFATRPGGFSGLGGVPEAGRWFRGPAALFGGIAWAIDDRLTFKAEYSSDAYLREVGRGVIVRRSPFSFGLDYQLSPDVRLGVYALHGSVFGLQATVGFDPTRRAGRATLSPAPLPVAARPDRRRDPDAWSTEWTRRADATEILRNRVDLLLAPDGMRLAGLRLGPSRAIVRVRNHGLDSGPQAVGRVARALSAALPASVETFVIVPEAAAGLAAVAVELSRADLEALEHHADGAELMGARARLLDAAGHAFTVPSPEGFAPALTWSLRPYGAVSLMDPDNPVRADIGLRLRARLDLAAGVSLTGSVRKRVIGNLNTVRRASDSVVQRVRSDYGLYDRFGDPALERLTLDWYFRPGPNLYGRMTAGYLETMYGGVSAELLWKPVDSRLGLGLEVNLVRQRAFNQLLGFRPYETVTGHVSAYYALRNGFHVQVDVGRYLARDWGATLSLDREFGNGWRVGGFVTITDMPFSKFGEGSFDKGIRVTVPLGWVTGRATRARSSAVIRPLTRDGGARVAVEGQLYEMVRGYHGADMQRQWGRFWR